MPVIERKTCARDSGWCDGTICRDNGVECPNADSPVCECGHELASHDALGVCVVCDCIAVADAR